MQTLEEDDSFSNHLNISLENLLKEDNILNTLYDNWLERDFSEFNQDIRDCIDDNLNNINNKNNSIVR